MNFSVRASLKSLVAGVCLVLPALGAPAPASPTFTAMNLEELLRFKVVTATAVPTDPFALPFMTQILTREDYERLLPRTMPQWLQDVPGVMLQKTAHGQISPYIRGFTGFRTLLLVDGIRVNNSVFREGPNQYWNTVDPLSLDRVEIVKGPASVLYGSDSIGGTVNALTLGRRDYEDGFAGDGRVFHRYSTAEDSHTTRVEASAGVGRNLGLHIGASWKQFGDLRGGRDVGRQSHTGYDEWDVDGKLTYFFRPNLKLTAAHQSVDQDDIWRAHSTIYGITWRGLRTGTDFQRSTDQHRRLSYVQFDATGLDSVVDEIHFSLSHQFQGEDQVRIRSDRRAEFAGVDVDTLGASLRFESSSPVGRWVYGGTYYSDEVDSSNLLYRADGSFDRAAIQGPVADDSTYDLIGAFVQNQLPSFGPVDVTLRGRYDHAEAKAGRVEDPLTGGVTTFGKGWDSFVASGRAVLRVDGKQKWNLFAGTSQGFRAPNLSDLTRLDIAGSGQIETPTLDLDPEYFLMSEAGIKARFTHGDAEAAYFYTDLRGTIIRAPTGRIIAGRSEVTKKNSGDGYIHGVEVMGSWRLRPQWTVTSSLTWMDGEVAVFQTASPVTAREPVSRLMPLTSRVALSWQHPQKTFWGELACTVAAKQRKLGTGDAADVERIPPGGTPGYAVGTLRAGWRPRTNAVLSVALENLTDTDYRVHGSGVNEPGRNLIVAGSYSF